MNNHIGFFAPFLFFFIFFVLSPFFFFKRNFAFSFAPLLLFIFLKLYPFFSRTTSFLILTSLFWVLSLLPVLFLFNFNLLFWIYFGLFSFRLVSFSYIPFWFFSPIILFILWILVSLLSFFLLLFILLLLHLRLLFPHNLYIVLILATVSQSIFVH